MRIFSIKTISPRPGIFSIEDLLILSLKVLFFFHYKISIYKEKERNIKVIRIIIRNGWGLKAGV